MSKLECKLLTRKRVNSTHGVPPGKEDLAWGNQYRQIFLAVLKSNHTQHSNEDAAEIFCKDK